MRRAAAALSALVIAASLTACTAAPQPEPTAAPIPVFEPTVVSGTGEVNVPLPLPDGAQSLRIVIGCTGNSVVSVDLGGFMEDGRDGQCGAVNDVVIPLNEASQGSLHVFLAEGAAFAAQLEFSADPLVPDPVVAAQCSSMGEVLSTILNGADAVRFGDSDEAQWRVEMDGALAQLATFDPDTMIGQLTAPMVAKLSDPAGTYEQQMFDESTQRLIGQLCANNGSTIAVSRHYGG